MAWGSAQRSRRSEIDVAAETLAAVLASGLVKRNAADRPVAGPVTVGVEPERVLLAMRRHADGKSWPPRDVAVVPTAPAPVPLRAIVRPRPDAPRAARLRVVATGGGPERRYDEATKRRVATRAREIGINAAATEAGVSWPAVRSWVDRYHPEAAPANQAVSP